MTAATNRIPIPTGLAKGAETAQWVLDQITTYPETHYQGNWWLETRCGSTGCVAGWAVQPYLKETGPMPGGIFAETEEVRSMFFASEGAKALGISTTDATYLFSGGRTYDEVVTALKKLANGEPLSEGAGTCGCDSCYSATY